MGSGSAPPPSPPQPPGSSGGDERSGITATFDRVGPGAGELAARLSAGLRTPGVAVACLSALAALAAALVVGLLITLIFPVESLLRYDLESTLNEVLVQAGGMTLANVHAEQEGVEFLFRLTPALFVLVPMAGAAGASAYLTRRRSEIPARTLVLWGAATGVPLGVGMLIIALIVGDAAGEGGGTASLSASGAFFLGILWGALGGGAGALLALRSRDDELIASVPERARSLLVLAWAALRPLAVGLALAAVIGTVALMIQVARDAGDVRGSDEDQRPTATALAESVLYAADSGVHYVELASGTEFRSPPLFDIGGIPPSVGLPLPVADVADVVADDSLAEADFGSFEEFEAALEEAPGYRIFDYNDAMPAWAFIPFLALVAIPALLALYAGFALARTAAATSPGQGALWGVLVGPVWAIAMVVLNALVNKDILGTSIYGSAVGESVLTVLLVGGALLGALGGFLGGQSSAPVESDSEPPAGPAPVEAPPAPPPA